MSSTFWPPAPRERKFYADYPYLEDEDITAVLEFAARQNDHPVLRSAGFRFPVDAQLPPALARRIEALGHIAEHVFYCGLASAADCDTRTYAVNVGAVIITKDEDFVVRKMLESGPAVVWVRIGNTRLVDLLRRLETHFAAILNALERGETLVEVV